MSGKSFQRASTWYTIVQFSCYAAGGYLLYANVQLSRLGLAAEGWGELWVNSAAVAIAAIEAAISIYVVSPDNWDDIYQSLAGLGGTGDKKALPSWLKVALSALVVGIVLAICFGAYAFDWYSNFAGLYGPGAEVTQKAILFCLAISLGTEVCAFLGHQVGRLGKIAKQDQLREAMEIEPQNIYAAEMRKHRNMVAKQAARDQIRAEKSAYAEKMRQAAGGQRQHP